MKKHVTAFYLETLILIVAFLGILLVLIQVFGLARAQSERAGRLTDAAALAEQAAEAVAASDSLEEVRALLNEGGGDAASGASSIREDTLEMPEDGLLLHVTWEPDGGLIRSHITIYWNEEELYSLETAAGREAAP